jgi:hypothetical protein
MQKLGLSSDQPRSDNRLKSLFWPTIQNATDIDSIGQQGLWLCFVIAGFTLVFSIFTPGALTFGLLDVLFFLLGGIGVRERGRLAAIAVLAVYVLGKIVIFRLTGQGIGIAPVLFSALLLANVRGAWLASALRLPAEEFRRERLNETIGDRIADQWPRRLWPLLKWLFWLVALVECAILVASLFVPRTQA